MKKGWKKSSIFKIYKDYASKDDLNQKEFKYLGHPGVLIYMDRNKNPFSDKIVQI